MKDKKKWKKIIPFALLALGTSTVAVACSKKPVSEIGPEAGAYYYDADNGEYFIYLNGENNFTFMVKDTTESGYFKFQFLLRRVFGRHGDVGGRSTYADLRKRYDALFEKGQL